MAVNNFDFIAPFYDTLAKLTFRKSLLHAQLAHVSIVQKTDHILIVGGGNGELLEHLPECQKVDYVEKSIKMLQRAKRRNVGTSVNFIHSDFLDWEHKEKYDVIVCPFFLDCFNEESLSKVIRRSTQLLTDSGKMIVTDFDTNQTHPFLLKLMIGFFRLFSRLEATRLSDIQSVILQEGFQEVENRSFKNGIFSAVYTRAPRK